MTAPASRIVLPRSIALIDVDTGTPQLDLIAQALTIHLIRDFLPRWFASSSGSWLSVRAASQSSPWTPGNNEWQCRLLETPLDPGALAEHMRDVDGTPILYGYPKLCMQDDSPVSAAICHEADEAIVDPFLRRGTQAGDGTWWAMECDDAVEGDTYSISAGGVSFEMSNFCYPAWFEPMLDANGKPEPEPVDLLGKCTGAFDVRTENGGYGQVWDPTKGWTMVGSMRAGKSTLHARGATRMARRQHLAIRRIKMFPGPGLMPGEPGVPR